MTDKPVLVSHTLCPYVQRAAIAFAEKGVPFQRVYVDLSDKPDWFKQISPLGKVPVLKVGEESLFESAAIVEYLEDAYPNPLHPENAVTRARHRAYMEMGSNILNGIAGLYNAPDEAAFRAKAGELRQRFERIEEELKDGPYFAGGKFTLVDAVFGPIFRYFDVFDRVDDFGILQGLEKVAAWRKALAERDSVKNAVGEDYPDLLRDFLRRRPSYLGRLAA
ncbi:glutathione S-transferase family protein [Stappia sp. F7233]|uniref:glutathione transferase n=1 Tax=Stappia albiluteola TaxID=2758565 RepID=A0A839AI39_9HYPH|nr:glutathione S-transferase family protein [Stappia albiluteola]MBA5778407.1 glutathione S-transferase family protein [Stappia albiluteola]